MIEAVHFLAGAATGVPSFLADAIEAFKRRYHQKKGQ